MDDLRATYTNEEDDDNDSSSNTTTTTNTVFNHPILTTSTITPPPLLQPESQPLPPPHSPNQEKPLHLSNDDDDDDIDSPKSPKLSQDQDEDPPPKKQKHLSSFTTTTTTQPSMKRMTTKKSKKKGNDVWTKTTSRKGKKKTKNNNNNNNNINHNAPKTEDAVLITPVPRFPTDDTADMKICLSKVYKAEKVELSEDRLSAGSTKGYRMVRATRGVVEGAWYYEIKVVKLGETGHTRLGWCMEKGDLQAPVGYDGNSFGYRDIDGSKIHKALREKYGEEKEKGYKEGDVIGFYICLPEGSLYAPKPPNLVLYKGQRYANAPPDGKEDPPKLVPGSEISFFKNGICQGVAFQNLCGGRYYPAASMYTLPNQPNCVVKFNFGPDFDFFPEDFGSRPIPRPMIEVPYHGFEGRVDNGIPSVSSRMCPMLNVVKEQSC